MITPSPSKVQITNSLGADLKLVSSVHVRSRWFRVALVPMTNSSPTAPPQQFHIPYGRHLEYSNADVTSLRIGRSRNFAYGIFVPPFAVPFWKHNFAPFSPILSEATAPLPSNPHPHLLHTCLLIHSYQTQTQ
jgi:hypothetical protein